MPTHTGVPFVNRYGMISSAPRIGATPPAVKSSPSRMAPRGESSVGVRAIRDQLRSCPFNVSVRYFLCGFMSSSTVPSPGRGMSKSIVTHPS